LELNHRKVTVKLTTGTNAIQMKYENMVEKENDEVKKRSLQFV